MGSLGCINDERKQKKERVKKKKKDVNGFEPLAYRTAIDCSTTELNVPEIFEIENICYTCTITKDATSFSYCNR